MSSEFTTEAFALLGVGLGIISLRTYARLSLVGIKGFKADDYLMILAAAVYSTETYLAYSVGAKWQGLANNAMTDEERRLLDPSSAEYAIRVAGSKTQVAGWSTYTFLLWILKACMCTFYLRLTDGLDLRNRIFVGFGLIFTTWVAVLLSILLGCLPMEKNWQIYPDPGNHCQPAISRIDIFVTVVLNVLTDIYLMSIPIPMLWNSSLRPAKKFGLILLFSGGCFVTMAGILRCVLIVTNPVTGAQQAGSWAVRETFVAVVTSNLPMIFPIVRRWTSPIWSTVRSVTSKISKSSRLNSSDPQPGAFILTDKNPRRGMGPRSVNPITNFTFSESEERIYDAQKNGGATAAATTTTTIDKASTSGGKSSTDERQVGTALCVGPSDVEAGMRTSQVGGIKKETKFQIVEQRMSRGEFRQEDVEGLRDYYLTSQVRKSEEQHGMGGTSKKDKRQSFRLGSGGRA